MVVAVFVLLLLPQSTQRTINKKMFSSVFLFCCCLPQSTQRTINKKMFSSVSALCIRFSFFLCVVSLALSLFFSFLCFLVYLPSFDSMAKKNNKKK